MKKINLNEVVWLGILTGFGSFIYYLFTTGRINDYIHPRMQGYVLMAMVVFGVLALVQIEQIFNAKRSGEIRWGNFVFIIPLLLAIAIDPTEIGVQALSNKGLVMDNHYHKEEVDINNHNTSDAKAFKYIAENLAEQLESMEGKEVKLTGFVYKGNECTENEFILARLIMSCCAADSWIQGIRCEWDNAGELRENQWVQIKAKVKYIESYNKETKEIGHLPVLKIQSINPVDIPTNPYIYY
ncbi:MAG: TIGR03943 family protein [Cellulosilyticaceae bacterium]